MTWFDAVAYCNALSRADKLEEAYVIKDHWVKWKGFDAMGYRLPTEAEWEYACRAGTSGDRYGDLSSVAWWKGNSSLTTHSVGQKLSNPWGFFDMLGNVFEWCWDSHGSYPSSAVKDPVGDTQDAEQRVARGGCYVVDADHSSAGFRYWAESRAASQIIGFRPVKSLFLVSWAASLLLRHPSGFSCSSRAAQARRC